MTDEPWIAPIDESTLDAETIRRIAELYNLVREAIAMVDSDNAGLCGGCFTTAFLEALKPFRATSEPSR